MIESAWPLKRLTIAGDAGCYEVEMVDGVVHRERTSGAGPSDFRRLTYSVAQRTLTMITSAREELVVETFDNDDQRERRAGRPVVYLDQNH